DETKCVHHGLTEAPHLVFLRRRSRSALCLPADCRNPLRHCTSPTSLRATAGVRCQPILRADASIPGIRRPPAALGLCFRGGERTPTTSERQVHACAAARGIRGDLL